MPNSGTLLGPVVAAALLAGAMPVLAQQATRATAPVYGHVVVFAMPAGFEPAYEDEQNGRYILELVPQGESVQDWSQMVTLTGAQGLQAAMAMEPKALVDWGLDEIAAGYQGACANPIIAEVFNDAPPPGSADGALAHLGCPMVTATGQSEQMMFWVTVAGDDLYTLQWAERGPGVETMEFDPPRWFDRFDLMKQMALCLPQAGEAAPYPSCLD